MPAPTFVAEYETVWNVATSPKTVSVTTAVGDVLVCFGLVENNSSTLGTPTGGTSLTWTLRQSISITDYCAAYVWTATATTAETFTLSVTRSGGGAAWWGLNCLRWSGSDGVGATNKTNVASGAPSLSLTTTGANSAVATGVGDWNAADGTTRTWRNGETEQTYFRDSAHYSAYVGRWNDSSAAGAKTLGLSAPTGQKYSILAVEVLGTSGAAPYPFELLTPTPRYH